MTDKFEDEVKETVSKIQDLSWDSLEVAEKQAEIEPLSIDSLVIDWIPDLIEEVIVNWHRPRVERWYIMPGLGEEAAEMHRQIRGEMERRDISHSDNRSKIPEPGSEAHELEIDRVAAILQEDTTRIYRGLLCQAFGLPPEKLDSSNSIPQVRGQAAMQDYIGGLDPAVCPPGALDLGILTEAELRRFRAQWAMYYGPVSALALCTPSRSRLTGRQ